MIGVLLRTSLLRLIRDPAGLLMVFLLPPAVFLVFASVFSGASAGRLELRAGLLDEIRTSESARFDRALSQRLPGGVLRPASEAELRRLILDGSLDAGVELKGALDGADPPAVILVHPGRRAAGRVLEGEVEAAARDGLAPAIARRLAVRVAPFLHLDADQFHRLRTLPFPDRPPPAFAREEMVGRGDPLVTYYAGAVSMLFLMFTAAQGAMILIDERLSGLRLRLALAAGGPLPLLGARFLWLSGLGLLQTSVLFAVAALLYGAPLLGSLAPFTVTALLASGASAGIGLALASLCANREQAQTVSTVLILILAAVGGAMAPRFLMPRWLQDLGWATPHAWAIEAYQAVLWSGARTGFVLRAWGVLALFGLLGFSIALGAEARRRL